MKRRGLSIILVFCLLVVNLVMGQNIVVAANEEGFTDVNTSYYKAEINALKQRGLILGYDDNTFLPTRKISRQEFVILISRFLNLQVEKDKTSQFSDVSDWAQPYVKALYDLGIFKGFNDNYFGAQEDITNEQVITIFVRTLGYDNLGNINIEQDYIDSHDISDYAKASVFAASKSGLTSFLEYSTETYQSYSKREVVAKIFYESYFNYSFYVKKIEETIKKYTITAIEAGNVKPLNIYTSDVNKDTILEFVSYDKKGNSIPAYKLPKDFQLEFSDNLGIINQEGEISASALKSAQNISTWIIYVSAISEYSNLELKQEYRLRDIFLVPVNTSSLNTGTTH